MPEECSHDSRPAYGRLIGPLREKARELGYALAVHGTLKRDIDLVAAPWTAEAVEARVLAEAVRDTARLHNLGIAHHKGVEDEPFFHAGCPGLKPHGRLCWSYHLGGGPYLDLSVMPKSYAGDWECPACESHNTSNPTCWHCGRPKS